MADTQQDAGPQPSPAIADLAGPDDKSMAGLVSSLTDLQRKKVATDTKISNESDDQQNRDRAVRNHAFQMEGVAASELPKPWDADKEHKKWESNPIDGFASAGGLFAMVASAFTKAPMENAINGMAGAINSIKEGNEAGYARAFDAFKTNVKLADQRFKTQHELYSDALSLGTADAAASSAKLHNTAVRFGDSQILMLAEHGMIKEIYELQEARAKSHEEMMKSADATDLHTVQKAAVDSVKKNPPMMTDPQTGQQVPDKMRLAAEIHNIYSNSYTHGTAEQEAVGRYMHEHPNDSADVIADGLAQIHQQFSAKAPNMDAYNTAVEQWESQHPGEQMPADERAKYLRMYGLTGAHGGVGGTGGALTEPKLVAKEIQRRADENIAAGMTPDEAFDKAMKEVKKAQQEGRGSLTRIDSAEVERRKVELKKEHPDWSDDKLFDTARTAVAAARTGGLLDDKARKVIAGQVKAGDNSGLVGLSPANRLAVRQEVATSLAETADSNRVDLKKQHPDWDDKMLDDAAKISPDQLGKTLALTSADYQGTRTALRALATRSVGIKQAAVEAQKFMKIAQDSSDRVPRGKFVKLNEIEQMIEHGTSDPDLKEFATANNALVQQYSRAIAPTGVPTDIVRRHAYDLLNTTDGPEAYKRVLKVMNQEMDAAIASPDAVRDMVMGTAKDTTSSAPTPPESFKTPVIKYDKDGKRVPEQRSDAGNGAVMSDADPDPIVSGANYASNIQIRPIGNGQVQVINIATGQVLYTGSASGASNAQANQNARIRRIE